MSESEQAMNVDPLFQSTSRSVPAPVGAAVDRAFGADNRKRLIDLYLAEAGLVNTDNAWTHIYRLLLWIDRTTGLAHCYESDKCQPGQPWYARSLVFHEWVSSELGVAPDELVEEIDCLFRWSVADLAATAEAKRAKRAAEAIRQREPYAGRRFPEPGSDPELESVIIGVLDRYLKEIPPDPVMRKMSQHIHAHVGQENKRKNLVGEGFEDVLVAILGALPGLSDRYEILARPFLHDLPGFHPPRGVEKTRKVDLALVGKISKNRILVSCKWSVRSDREEQFRTDFGTYAALEASGDDFSYVLVTNEFDPARLAAACDMRRENARLFTSVVHVNPLGPRKVYSAPVARRTARSGQARAVEHMDSGRLASLGAWLVGIGA